jgi:hypothetical protein
MHVKGLEFFQAEPRGLKGYALGLAVSSRGGDHLRSEPSFELSGDARAGLERFGATESVFRLEYKGKGRLVKHFEELCALADGLDACKNTIVNIEVLPFDLAADFLEAATGMDFDADGVQRASERIVNLERLFNARRGLTWADDTLPEPQLRVLRRRHRHPACSSLEVGLSCILGGQRPGKELDRPVSRRPARQAARARPRHEAPTRLFQGDLGPQGEVGRCVQAAHHDGGRRLR